MKKLILNSAVAAACGVGFSGNANAAMAADAVLDFVDSSIDIVCTIAPDPTTTSGCFYDIFDEVVVGSYFAMDTDGSGVHEEVERVELASAGTGVTMGSAQAAGEIDSWSFFGAPGFHFTTAGPTITSDDGAGNVTADLNWWVNWNAGNIDMSTGVDATITCAVDCSVGDTFVLDYEAFVPDSDPSFGGVFYAVHLEGTIEAIPVPAAVWLFGSGLLGLVGVARRRKAA